MRPLMSRLELSYREEAWQLVGRAYSTVRLADLGQYVGMPEEEVAAAAAERGWPTTDGGMVRPVGGKEDRCQQVPTEEQLERLTDFISYLEN